MSVAEQVAPAIPAVGPLRDVRLPQVAETTLRSGLRVLACRRPGIPRVEVRLHVPLARGGSTLAPALRRVLTASLLGGTATRSAERIAEDLQAMGAGLDATADADDLIVHGSTLSNHLDGFLDLLADVVMDAAFPDDEVELQRDRAVQDLRVAHSQPDIVARHAFLRRLYGKHPYGAALPSPDAAARVGPGALLRARDGAVLPKGSVLVLVGDLRPDKVLARVEERFAPWRTRGGAPGLPAPHDPRRGPVEVVDRPGAVQTNIRMGRLAVRRDDPDHSRLVLANLVFGGYFAGRLSTNIREDKGYTYGAYSVLESNRSAAHLFLTTNVATEVTGSALVEIRYELGRMVAEPPPADELVAAKRYLAGSLAMGIATQPGLAAMLAMLATNGLPVSYLREFPARVESLGPDDALEAARRWLTPRNHLTVMVGDAARIVPTLEHIDDVVVKQ